MLRTTPFVLTAALLAGLSACGGASDSAGSESGTNGGGGSVSLVAYSTPKVVYDEIVPDFQKTGAGKDVEVRTSFGASGDQSRAVEAGQKADVVSFSVEPDITRLVDAGKVAEDWNTGANKGLVTTSVVSFIVRKGNPKKIRNWDDLLKPGIEVVTPSPQTSGAAKWNLLAAYGQAAGSGNDEAAGLAYVGKLLSGHVKVQPKSGREALQTFLSGDADVLLSYEYEATTAQKQGEELDYVLPDDTIKIDIDIAATTTASDAGKRFLDYVLSEPAQQRFADWGYRPVNEAVLAANKAKFPTPSGLFTIDDVGGWKQVNDDLFDPQAGKITKLEEKAGLGKE